MFLFASVHFPPAKVKQIYIKTELDFKYKRFPSFPQMRLLCECGFRQNFSVNEVHIKRCEYCLAEIMYKGEEAVHSSAGKIFFT